MREFFRAAAFGYGRDDQPQPLVGARHRVRGGRLAARVRRMHSGVLGGTDLRVVRATIPGRGTQLWYTVQAPAGSRNEAMNFCLRLRRSGAICRIHRN